MAERPALRAAISEDQFNSDGAVFKSVNGQRISENNFQKRYWVTALARLKIRPRPFRNTRHTYISQMLKIGMNPEQVGTSYKMIKEHYQKYIPNPQDWNAVERMIGQDQRRQRGHLQGQPVTFTVTQSDKRKRGRLREKKKPPINRGLRNGAGEEGRTPDLMLGNDKKHRRRR